MNLTWCLEHLRRKHSSAAIPSSRCYGTCKRVAGFCPARLLTALQCSLSGFTTPSADGSAFISKSKGFQPWVTISGLNPLRPATHTSALPCRLHSRNSSAVSALLLPGLCRDTSESTTEASYLSKSLESCQIGGPAMDGLTEQLHSAPSRASFYVAISGQVEQ